MKTLTKLINGILATQIIVSAAGAESLIKGGANQILQSGQATQGSAASGGDSLFKGDPNAILNAGTGSAYATKKVVIQPGVYTMGSAKEQDTERYLIVENYINNSEKVFAIMLEKNRFQAGNAGKARLYLGNPVRNGATIKLSPVSISSSGNLISDADMNPNSPVLMVSLDGRAGTESVHYPYIVQPLNGALSEVWGMRAANIQIPRFVSNPVDGLYAGYGNGDLLVQAGVLSMNGGWVNHSFVMAPVNGFEGHFAQLMDSDFNTLSEIDETETDIKALAFGIVSLSGKNQMVILRPSTTIGEYNLQVFGTECRTLLDILMPGSTVPGTGIINNPFKKSRR